MTPWLLVVQLVIVRIFGWYFVYITYTWFDFYAGFKNIVNLDEGWEKTLSTGEATLPEDLPLDNLAYIVYSSGTTGKPKG